MDAAMCLITRALGTVAARSFCRCLLLTSLAPHGAPSVTFPPGTLSSPLHQLLLGMVSISCQLQPRRVSIPLAGVSSWQTPGCSPGGGKAMRGVSRAREIENRASTQRSQAGSKVSPGPCPGRPRCGRKAGRGKAMFPYASPAAPRTRMYPLWRQSPAARAGGAVRSAG